MEIEHELAQHLAGAHQDSLLLELFGGAATEAIAAEIVKLVTVHGDPVGVRLVRLSSGVVVALNVRGPHATVVVKVHRAPVVDRLAGVIRAQRLLAIAGLPVTTPLADSPVSMGTGAATLETWRADGKAVDVRPAPLRRALARCMYDIITALDPDQFPELVSTWRGLYPPPHAPHFDFVATSKGAEWIDEQATGALARRCTLEGIGRRVVAHTDVRPENVLLDVAESPTVSTIYDLDSLCVDTEPWMVGATARAFSTNWSLDDPMIPTSAQIHAFLRDYENVRGDAFSADEAALVDAGVVHALAYSARCEHALFPDGAEAPWGPGWRALLREFTHPGSEAGLSNVRG